MAEGAAGRDTIMPSDLESIKKKELFTYAMKGKWEHVIYMYRNDPRVHKARITRAGDTALHIAVSEGKDEVVAEMVRSIMSYSDELHFKEALQTHNNKGNTALHLAAAMGNSTICEIIAGVEPSLVDCRNGEGETPLFSAALFGRSQAFLCLHYIQNPNLGYTQPSYVNCRRNDGDTFLHCAISGDYFELAVQIIHLYGDLVTSVNEDGLSPLHLLAAKPSNFRSGCHLGRLEGIIYHGLYVDKLKEPAPPEVRVLEVVKDDQEIHLPFPPNYHVVRDTFNVIKSMLRSTPTVTSEWHVRDHGSGLFPANYRTCFHFVKFLNQLLRAIPGQGKLYEIHRMKEKHTWSVQIMNELLDRASDYEYQDNFSKPDFPIPIPDELSSLGVKLSTSEDEGVEDRKNGKKETPILIAAKNGVIEMVKEILRQFPVAIYDENKEKKNAVLLAVKHRQPGTLEALHRYITTELKKTNLWDDLIQSVDTDGNNILHLVAKYELTIQGSSALQMQHEIKWYEHVKSFLPSKFTFLTNKTGQTPGEIFLEHHKDLFQRSDEWLSRTSESCSVVAALVAGVSFATSSSVPGGNDDKTGKPTLEGQPGFDIFSMTSLIALCLSVTALIMFLSIFTSRKQPTDFMKKLPLKLFLALSSLFGSIFSMFISFCAAHSFMLEDKFKKSVIFLYIIIGLPVSLTIVEFPLYMDLFKGIFMKVQRSYDQIRI